MIFVLLFFECLWLVHARLKEKQSKYRKKESDEAKSHLFLCSEPYQKKKKAKVVCWPSIVSLLPDY